MIRYTGFAQVVEVDPNHQKPRENSYGGNPRTSSSNKQIVGHGGSHKGHIGQTRRTECHDYYPHRVGVVIVQPSPLSNQAQVREWTNSIKNENKQTGSYVRATMKEKVTAGETRVEKSTGRYGIADEYKRSSNVKVGDRTGYTEYYSEERVRRVNYDGNKNSTGRLIQGNQSSSISVKHGSGSGMKISSVNVNHGKSKITNVSINHGSKKSTNSSGGKRMAK